MERKRSDRFLLNLPVIEWMKYSTFLKVCISHVMSHFPITRFLTSKINIMENSRILYNGVKHANFNVLTNIY